MKRVLILQHIDQGGPGLFAEFLDEAGVPFEIRRPDRGDPVPDSSGLGEFSGICLCGGTQSANDPHDWIDDEIALVRAAAGRDTPVIGHCLGGQLISRALGGTVTRQEPVEFGWHALRPVPGSAADHWLDGLPRNLVAMQWHNERFDLPAGAELLLEGTHCRHQAFVHGRMLGMQFHVELTEQLIRHWTDDLRHLIPASGVSVQSAEEVTAAMDKNFPRSRALARRLYERWLKQIA
jgi:GMP synthase-like glutamine amidotransferase